MKNIIFAIFALGVNFISSAQAQEGSGPSHPYVFGGACASKLEPFYSFLKIWDDGRAGYFLYKPLALFFLAGPGAKPLPYFFRHRAGIGHID